MTAELSSIDTSEKKKPGPVSTKAIEAMIQSDKEKIEMLEAVLCHLATLTGYGNMLKLYGLERWQPNKNDMSKYKS